jgi:hypothetical protein
MVISRQTLAAILLFAGAALGCSRQPADRVEVEPDPAWRLVSADALTEKQQSLADRALAARERMFGQLMSRLQEAMQEGSPVTAMEVCKQDAPQIALEVARAEQLRIGRTSFKLRNSENRPPAWAESLVADRVTEPSFVARPDGSLGVLLPIRVQPECLQCHGSAEEISDEVRRKISELYPSDQATGFAEGDLRGWFWVEVTP